MIAINTESSMIHFPFLCFLRSMNCCILERPLQLSAFQVAGLSRKIKRRQELCRHYGHFTLKHVHIHVKVKGTGRKTCCVYCEFRFACVVDARNLSRVRYCMEAGENYVLHDHSYIQSPVISAFYLWVSLYTTPNLIDGQIAGRSCSYMCCDLLHASQTNFQIKDI